MDSVQTVNLDLIKYLNQLCDNSKLERDRSEEKLSKLMINKTDCDIIIEWIQGKLNDKSSFEECLGCLMAVKYLMEKYNNVPLEFAQEMTHKCVKLLSHDEFRVRILAGDCVGLCCKIIDSHQFMECIDIVTNAINSSLHDSLEDASTDTTSGALCDTTQKEAFCSKSLETWMRCFQAIIKGIGIQFEDIANMEMLLGIFNALDTKNRFIRETGYDLLGTVAENRGCVRNREIYITVCTHLRTGLKDNWSQVRMAASVATRKILASTKAPGIEDKEIHSILLPGICLNRYYIAEGVRLFNQETWRMTVGDRGKELLEQYLEETVAFYIEQSDSNNHTVREAACTSISEIAVKLNKDSVRPFLSRLLDALIVCFIDDSWPVREMACMASGRLVTSFPGETKEYRSDALVPLFLNKVMDNVINVREGGAYSLASVVGAYDSRVDKYLQEVVTSILENLENIKNQKAESGTVSTIDKNSTSALRAVKGVSDQHNEDIGYTEKQKNSCGLIIPRMLKGSAKSHSHDGFFFRFSEPWEKADGCILLIGELSLNAKDSHTYMDQLLPSMVKACSYRHYPHYVYLLGTACKTISNLCDGLGKQTFKRYLSDLLTIINDSFSTDCNFTLSEAENTVRFLSSKVGKTILRGRIELFSSDLLAKTEHLLSP